MAIPSSGTIDPSKFATRWQETAIKAQQADESHTAFIKGTAKRSDIQTSFLKSVESFNPSKSTDRVTIGQHQKSPDGGMRDLARSLGRR